MPVPEVRCDRMYVEHLHVKRLKLLRDFELSFLDESGAPRMWTVLIGENGTAKTSILQAIALAAAGYPHAALLANSVKPHLRDRRANEPLSVTARFRFSPLPAKAKRQLPSKPRGGKPHGLLSTWTLDPEYDSINGESSYLNRKGARIHSAASAHARSDPLGLARSKHMPLWFVAGYGVARHLPEPSKLPRLNDPSIERMQSLFDPSTGLTSTAFVNYFEPKKAKLYSRVLKKVLLKASQLLPDISNIELRGRGGVKSAGDLIERDRFSQAVGSQQLKLPLLSLSNGYQSMIGWLADLIGHIVLESETELRPEDMRGLVLVDELDAYLHPHWQLGVIRALRDTFPGLQFVVTTHSPLLLVGIRPGVDQVIRLSRDVDSGDVVGRTIHEDPRLLTGTEILRDYFGIDDVHPSEEGRALREYMYLAANPYRSKDEDAELKRLRRALKKQDIDPHYEPVPRDVAAGR